MITTRCDACGKTYKLPDNTAGKKAKCKACSAVMTIPSAKPAKSGKPAMDDDPLGLGVDPGRGSVDLSGLYNRGGADPIAAPPPPSTEPVGFSPMVSFSNVKGSSGPPMKLIIGGIGGLVALLLVVGVIIVIANSFSGGGKPDDPTGGGLSLGGVGQTPTRPLRSTGGGETDGGDEGSDPTGITAQYPGASRLRPAAGQPISDWTLQVEADTLSAVTRPVSLRGFTLPVPKDWNVIAPGEKMDDKPLVETSDKAAMLLSEAEERLGMVVMVYRPSVRPTTVWPSIYEVSTMAPEMVGGVFDESDTDEDLPGFGLNPEKPTAAFVRKQDLMDIKYGTLFGGYPFVRLEVDANQIISPSEESKLISRVIYLGYLGDLLVMATYDRTPSNTQEHLAGLQALLCSAQLLTKEQAGRDSENDTKYAEWLGDADTRLVFADSKPPMSGKPAATDVSTSDLLAMLESTAGRPDLLHPIGRPYGFALPEGLEVAATTRAAVRAGARDDGFWAAMEVHKLSGFERRQQTPIDAGGKTMLVRGVSVMIDPEVERTQMQSDDYTIYRLLPPAAAGDTVRNVEYVIKDGAYLITLLGRYPADAPELLDALDAMAMSVAPVAGE